jgi:tripeptidyl-peptidase-1
MYVLQMSISGTSCSTPMFAGLIALLNDAREQVGLPPMGFLNPFLYANPDIFTVGDISHLQIINYRNK